MTRWPGRGESRYDFRMANPRVKLIDLTNDIEESHEEMSAYLDRETGEVVIFTDEDSRASEEEDGVENAPEWQKESIELAGRVLADATDRYLPLPTSFDAEEWSMMEKFTLTVTAEPARSVLESAIHGKGAFGRFKDAVHRYDLSKAWQALRDAEYRDLTIAWCEAHGVEFEE